MDSNESVQGAILHKSVCKNNLDLGKTAEGSVVLRS